MSRQQGTAQTGETNVIAADIVGLAGAPAASRREFMGAAAAAAAGYTLAAGPVRAEAINTDSEGLEVREATVKVARGDMPVYVAQPKGAKNPATILVAMEIFGLHAHIKDVVRRLAKAGYRAVAPDYYFTLGDLSKVTDIKQLMPLVNSKSDAELVADLDACADWAMGKDGDGRLGIVGFCRGGRSVWVYCAESTKPKAGVAFYGSLVDPPAQKALWPKSPMELASAVKVPVLGLYGEADQGIPVAQVEAMREALKAAGKEAEFKIYPGAPHGFHADYRPSYRKEAAEDAWSRALQWFAGHGVK